MFEVEYRDAFDNTKVILCQYLTDAMDEIKHQLGAGVVEVTVRKVKSAQTVVAS